MYSNEYLNKCNNLIPTELNTANKAVSSNFNVAEVLSSESFLNDKLVFKPRFGLSCTGADLYNICFLGILNGDAT